MRRPIEPILALLLVAGCQQAPAPERKPVDRGPEPDQLTELSGYYEGESGDSRLCVVGDRFGLVVRGRETASCSGSGRLEREPAGIRFVMRGDSPCTFTARVAGRTLLFPGEVPSGCSYYCAAGASMAGVRLAQQGIGREQAARARDFAGDSLCEGR